MRYVTPKEQRARREKAAAANRPLFPSEKWNECWRSWLDAKFNKSGSIDTKRNYASITRQFFSDPKRNPDQYSRQEVETFLNNLAHHRGDQHTTAPATHNARLRALRSFYKYAAEYDVAVRKSRNSGKMIYKPLLQTHPPTRGVAPVKTALPRRALTEEQLKQLFAAMPRATVIEKRDYALFLCYFWTARRRAEILRLKWGDIFEVTFADGRKTWAGHMYRYTPKGHAREVFTAELHLPAWEAIIDYLRASGRMESMTPDSPIFIRHDNARHPSDPDCMLDRSTPNRILHKYIKLAGLEDLPVHICTHSMRHCRARYTFKRVPGEKGLTEVQELLGHGDIRSTVVYLVEYEQKHDKTAVLLMDDFGHL